MEDDLTDEQDNLESLSESSIIKMVEEIKNENKEHRDEPSDIFGKLDEYFTKFENLLDDIELSTETKIRIINCIFKNNIDDLANVIIENKRPISQKIYNEIIKNIPAPHDQYLKRIPLGNEIASKLLEEALGISVGQLQYLLKGKNKKYDSKENVATIDNILALQLNNEEIRKLVSPSQSKSSSPSQSKSSRNKKTSAKSQKSGKNQKKKPEKRKNEKGKKK